MKSKAQVLRERPEYKTLINGVLNNIDFDEIEMVNSHGADVGIGNFIYYTDTHKFAMRYRKLIVKMLEEQADEFGTDVVSMVAGFGVFRNSPMDNEDKRELYKYLGGGRNEQSTITNVMAWYALEEVCRMFDN